MFSFVMSIVDMDTIKKRNNTEDFDYDKYPEGPIENTRKNKMIEKFQIILFAIPCVLLLSLLFIDFHKWEVGIIFVVCGLGFFVLDQFKDKEAERKYEEYASWELELEELQEEYDD